MMASAPGKITSKELVQNAMFIKALEELTGELSTSFAKDNVVSSSLKEAHQKVLQLKAVADSLPEIVQTFVKKWSDATNGEWIWKNNAEHLLAHIEASNDDFMRSMNLKYLFHDDAASFCREGLWARLKVITRIASEFDDYQGTGRHTSSKYPQLGNAVPLAIPGNPTANTPAATQAATNPVPKLDPERIKETIKANMPLAMDVMKQFLSNGSGDNPLKAIMQMMKDPSIVGSDLASNVAGLAMTPEDQTVLDETEATAVDNINSRLDGIEKEMSNDRKDNKAMMKMLAEINKKMSAQ